jgi:hypothetical protein
VTQSVLCEGGTEVFEYKTEIFQSLTAFFLQRLPNKVVRVMRGFPKYLPICDLHVALKIM